MIPGKLTPAFTCLVTLAALRPKADDAGDVVVGLIDGQVAFYRIVLGDQPGEAPGVVYPASRHTTLNPVLFVSC